MRKVVSNRAYMLLYAVNCTAEMQNLFGDDPRFLRRCLDFENLSQEEREQTVTSKTIPSMNRKALPPLHVRSPAESVPVSYLSKDSTSSIANGTLSKQRVPVRFHLPFSLALSLSLSLFFFFFE